MRILQHFIVPVLSVVPNDRTVLPSHYFGTAFFINGDGVFLTARHVIEECEAEVASRGGECGLGVCKPGDDSSLFFGKVIVREFAPPPYDIAIGIIDVPTRAAFVFGETQKLLVWDDVYTAGYPITAVHRDHGGSRIDARGHKGYVLRKVPQGHLLIHPHPDVIEVNFSITKGLSGAPVVQRDQRNVEGASIDHFVLVGICVNNEPAEIVDFRHTEVSEEGKEFSETTSRIEEYGIVHDLRPLADWKPACLGGITLRNAIVPNA
ncbi:MAG TPA: serine protease [Alphaproteobacteria bacterium]|nr:serine protease [Alphaproteobacteria bacterium]